MRYKSFHNINIMKMIALEVGKLPHYVREGKFYQNLVNEDEERKDSAPVERSTADDKANGFVIEIPIDCIKMNEIVNDEEDLHHLLKTLRFWLVDNIPCTMLEFILDSESNMNTFRKVVEGYKNDLPHMYDLLSVARCGWEVAKTQNSANPFNQQAMNRAAACGLLQCMEYLQYKGCPWSSLTCIEAGTNGHLECLQYALKHGCPPGIDLPGHVAGQGHLNCLKYLHERGCAWDGTTCTSAAEHGHLNCLKYLHEHGCAWNSYTCLAAASQGHLDCLQYAHEHGCALHRNTCSTAASKGHLACLQYAHEHGCRFDSFTCSAAVLNGHLDCLQYAHAQGFPWGAMVCEDAARAGNLDCLQYLHEHGCPWDQHTILGAAEHRHPDCLAYALDHGCPTGSLSSLKMKMRSSRVAQLTAPSKRRQIEILFARVVESLESRVLN